jgi:uncharacterized OB-fold protein
MADRPLPIPDADTLPFWEGCKRHELLAQQCEYCAAWRWPPGEFCPVCHCKGGVWTKLDGTGEIVSFVTLSERMARGGEPVIALVTLDGTRGRVTMRSNIIGCSSDSIAVGMSVVVSFRDVSDSITLPLFTPH